MTSKRQGTSLRKAAAWPPAGTPQPRVFAVAPLTAARRPAPPGPVAGFDCAGQPARSLGLTLPPVFPGMQTAGAAEALPDTVDLPLEAARRTAAQAARSPVVPLPFGERIQQSFGHFDVRGVQAHLGSAATASARSLGARAFAAGEHVTFSGRPDLQTAAHEAAHVIQQRAGVVPADGIGRPGDPHERHADAVAERVVAGRTAEPLLHRFIGPRDASRVLPQPASAAPAVQREIDEEALSKALAKEIGADATFDQYKKWLLNDTGFAWSAMETGYAVARVEDFKAALEKRVDLDFEQEVKGSEIAERRLVQIPIFVVPLKYSFTFGAGERLEVSGDTRPISRMPPAFLVPLLENADQFYAEEIGRIKGKALVFRNGNRPGESYAFFRKDRQIRPAELGKELLLRYHVLFDEPEGRTGEQRAAPDSQVGKKRQPSDTEAEYAAPVRTVGPPKGTRQYQTGQSLLSIEMGSNQIQNTMVHKGPWTKGSRTPGQAAVMGGQSAKNYVIDQILPGKSEKEKEAARKAMGGRYEWLHVIGSSLGGLNVLGNLVAGSYDANTKMIALEHRVALWAPRDYQRRANAQASAASSSTGSTSSAPLASTATADADADMKDTEAPIAINSSTPLTIVGTADVEPGTFVATRIGMTVSHGDKELASGEYKANDQTVITKTQYAAEKERIDQEISAARST